MMFKVFLGVGFSILLKSACAQTPAYSFVDSLPRGQALATLAEGKVAGYRQPGGVATFLGIPYAEPPVGNLRFRPPKVIAPWAPSVRDATNFASDCMQSTIGSDGYLTKTSEDCLYVNVWTPAGPRVRRAPLNKHHKSKKLAVMVWVHGGAWQIGGSSRLDYNGAKLAASGVVVVNFNYRLGAFGFLTSVKDGLYGNYGLMDQRCVFHWVQRNIVHFGGDPSRVTLFGESAGAKSIGLHLLMPGAGGGGHGLFQRAILQSNPYGYRYRTGTVASWLGERFKEKVSCENAGVRCLQDVEAWEIVEAMDELRGVPRSVGDFFTWAPVLTQGWGRTFNFGASSSGNAALSSGSTGKGTTGSRSKRRGITGGKSRKSNAAAAGATAEASGPGMAWANAGGLPRPVSQRTNKLRTFASSSSPSSDNTHSPHAWNVSVAQPLEAMSKSSFQTHDVAVVMGTNAHEGHLFVYTISPVAMNRAAYWFFVGALFKQHAPRVLDVYAPFAEEICELNPDTQKICDYRPVLSQIINDYLFRCPSWRAAQLLSEKAAVGVPVYVYEFAHPTKTEGYPVCHGLTCHTSEVPFVFNQISLIWANYSATLNAAESADAAAAEAQKQEEEAAEMAAESEAAAEAEADDDEEEDGTALDARANGALAASGGAAASASASVDSTELYEEPSSIDLRTVVVEVAGVDARSNTLSSISSSNDALMDPPLLTTVPPVTTAASSLGSKEQPAAVTRRGPLVEHRQAIARVALGLQRSAARVAAGAQQRATRAAESMQQRASKVAIGVQQRAHEVFSGSEMEPFADEVPAVAAALKRASSIRASPLSSATSSAHVIPGQRQHHRHPVSPWRAVRDLWQQLLGPQGLCLQREEAYAAEQLVRQVGEHDPRDRVTAKALGNAYWRALQQMLKWDNDAIVARVTAARWASFAKSGDPNDDLYGILAFEQEWPIWYNRNVEIGQVDDEDDENEEVELEVEAQGNYGDGDLGRGEEARASNWINDLEESQENNAARRSEPMSAPFDKKYSEEGESGHNTRAQEGPRTKAALNPARKRPSVYASADGGPLYLEIANPHQLRHVGRDCFCELWDEINYRH